MRYKFEYSGNTVVFYKNVLPVDWHPLWNLDFVASNFYEIEKSEYIKLLSQDEIESILWFFLDCEENQ